MKKIFKFNNLQVFTFGAKDSFLYSLGHENCMIIIHN